MSKHPLTALTMMVGLLSMVALLSGAEPTNGVAKPTGLVPPKSHTGWYSHEESEQALQAAKILGKPLAIMYQDSQSTCPLHNGQREAWAEAPQLSSCVRLVVEARQREDNELLTKLRGQAKGKEGKFIPMLFLGDTSGTLLGVVPYKEPEPQFLTTVDTALKKFGPMTDPRKAKDVWSKFEQGKGHWEKGNIDAALSCYRVVKNAEKQGGKLSVFEEFRAEEEKILAKGTEELASAEELFQQDKQREARTAIAKIVQRYAGFQTAEDAKKLLKDHSSEPASTSKKS